MLKIRVQQMTVIQSKIIHQTNSNHLAIYRSLVFVWKYVLKRNLTDRFKHSTHICVYFGWSEFTCDQSHRKQCL